uniref:C2 domain-containing protein n=3 Tax=Hemiselmis andersenii TaxID=464988 RepID=A0A6T8NGB6_HEMAN|mmetsp:Transcript_37051/g.86409  ORF Transcript_37051/g.86409 Transcript_37051/m.86409 type:complete len:1013 (+) Transcript_37051:273-3311(+)
MKKQQTLSMKFSPLAPVPKTELKARKDDRIASLSMTEEGRMEMQRTAALEQAKADDGNGHAAPATLRRDDFLSKEFYLPNTKREVAGPIRDVDEATLKPMKTLTQRSEHLHDLRTANVPKSDGLVTGLLSTFEGHTNVVTCLSLAVIEDEEFLFTGSMDCTVRVFSVVTNNCVRSFEGHSDFVTSLQVANVVGSERHSDISRTIHDTLNPRWANQDLDLFEFKLQRMEKFISVRCYDYDMVGEHDLIGSFEINLVDDFLQGNHEDNPTIVEWYTLIDAGKERGQIQLEFRWDNYTMTLGIFLIQGRKLPAMDGLLGKSDPYVTFTVQDCKLQRLFSASADGTARCWDVYDGKSVQTYKGHNRAITQVKTSFAFSKMFVFTSSQDRTVRMWDIDTGECLKIVSHDTGVSSFLLHSISAGETRQVTEAMIKVPADIKIRVKYDHNPMNKTQSLSVTVHEARNLPAMDAGKGNSDPYVIVQLGDTRFETRVCKKTLNPKWNEQFVFEEFRMDMELVVSIYDWDAVNMLGVGQGDFIGHVAILIDQIKVKRLVNDWFPVDYNPYSPTYLYTGCTDGIIRTFDLRLGTQLREFTGHKGGVTGLMLVDHFGEKLFSSSLDTTIKMWDISPSKREAKAMRSWVHPDAVTSLATTSILTSTRIFAACNNGIIYMNSLPSTLVVAEESWRAKLGKLISSLPVAVAVLLCCLIDAISALYFEFGVPADQVDCFARDTVAAVAIVFFVLAVFTIELAANILASGKSFFVPFVFWNYMDFGVVTISLGVAFYKINYDLTTVVEDANGNHLPPVVSQSSHPEVCDAASGTAASSNAQTTQKSLTTIRIARMVARIAVGVRVLRAIVKASKIAARLGDLQKGREFRGHDAWVSCVECVEPTEGKMPVWQKLTQKVFGAKELDQLTIDEYRVQLRRRNRFFSASADGRVFMWDPTSDAQQYQRTRPRFDLDLIAKSSHNLLLIRRKTERAVVDVKKVTGARRLAELAKKDTAATEIVDEAEIIRLAV